MITYELIVSIERRSVIGKTLNTIGPLQAHVLGAGLINIGRMKSDALIMGCMGVCATHPGIDSCIGEFISPGIFKFGSYGVSANDVGRYFDHDGGTHKVTNLISVDNKTVELEDPLTFYKGTTPVLIGPKVGETYKEVFKTITEHPLEKGGTKYYTKDGKTAAVTKKTFVATCTASETINAIHLFTQNSVSLENAFGYLVLSEGLYVKKGDKLYLSTRLIKRIGNEEIIEDTDDDNWKNSVVGKILPLLDQSTDGYKLKVKSTALPNGYKEYYATSTHTPGSHLRVWTFDAELVDGAFVVDSIQYRPIRLEQVPEIVKKSNYTTFELSVNWRRAGSDFFATGGVPVDYETTWPMATGPVIIDDINASFGPILDTYDDISPDGSFNLDNGEIYSVDYENSEYTVTSEVTLGYGACWSPDGHTLYTEDYPVDTFGIVQYAMNTPFDGTDLKYVAFHQFECTGYTPSGLFHGAVHPSGRFFATVIKEDGSPAMWLHVFGMREPFQLVTAYSKPEWDFNLTELAPEITYIAGVSFDQTGAYLFINALVHKYLSFDIIKIGEEYTLQVGRIGGVVEYTTEVEYPAPCKLGFFDNNAKVCFANREDETKNVATTNLTGTYPTQSSVSGGALEWWPVLYQTLSVGAEYTSIAANSNETTLVVCTPDVNELKFYTIPTPGRIDSATLLGEFALDGDDKPSIIRFVNGALYVSIVASDETHTIRKYNIGADWLPSSITEEYRVSIPEKMSWDITPDGLNLITLHVELQAWPSPTIFLMTTTPMSVAYDLRTLDESGTSSGVDVRGMVLHGYPTDIQAGFDNHSVYIANGGCVTKLVTEDGDFDHLEMTDEASLLHNVESFYIHPVTKRVYTTNSDGDGSMSVYNNIRYPDFFTHATLSTFAATEVTTDSATLHGFLADDEYGVLVTETGFNWGIDPENLENTIPVGNTVGPFSHTITELNSNTTYYFQAYATDGDTMLFGSVLVISTETEAEITTDGHALMVGSAGYYARSSDSGHTWTVEDTGSQEWKGCSFLSDGHALMVGFGGHYAYSSDYGQTWTFGDTGSQDWRNCDLLPDGRALMVGFDGYYAYSSDYGQTWTVKSAGSEDWQGCFLLPDGRALMVGSAGYYARSSDYGQTWTVGDTGSHTWIGCFLLPDGHALMVGFTGYYAYSSDHGHTWTTKLTGGGHNWVGCHLLPDGRALMVGNSGYYAYSSDYGHTWTFGSVGTNIWYNCSLLPDGRAIMAGKDGYYAYSSDYGNTWTLGNIGTYNWVGCSMISEKTELGGFAEATLSTLVATDMTSDSATLQGLLVNDVYSSTVTETGFLWGIQPDTLENTIPVGNTVGPFSHTITGLDPDTTYYFQAYATDGVTTLFGEILSAETSWFAEATLSTFAATEVTTNSATLQGLLVDDEYSSTVTETGFKWGTGLATLTNTVIAGDSTGDFSFELTELNSNTTYYFRAYATDGNIVKLGEILSFTTEANFSDATIITSPATNITTTSVTVNARLVDDLSGSLVTETGFKWGTSLATLTNSQAVGDSTGDFSFELNDLNPDTTYYFRAYATDGITTLLGSIRSAETEAEITADGNAIMVRASGVYAYSSDHGHTWTMENTGGDQTWYDCSLLPDGHALMMGANGSYAYSSDCGNTWTTGDTGDHTWFGCSLLPDGHALMVGGVDYYAYSSDYGQTWTTGDTGSQYRGWNSCSLLPDGHALMVGKDGYYAYSSDYGHTWTIEDDSSDGWLGCSLLPDGHAIMVGYSGVYAYSSDHGHTWTMGDTGDQTTWISCSLLPDGNAIMGGLSGEYAYSSDYGHTWTLGDAGYHKWNSCSLLPDGHALMVSNAGVYAYSSDHGHTWTIENTGGGQYQDWLGCSMV